MYIGTKPRKRFNFRLNEKERAQIAFIMQCEEIPDVSKAIRYCIDEKAKQLQAAETPQEMEGAA